MVEIPVRNSERPAVVDDADAERVTALTWKICSDGRPWAKIGAATRMPMHRFVVNAPARLHVGHANGDPLDNRRENLRLQHNNTKCGERRLTMATKAVRKARAEVTKAALGVVERAERLDSERRKSSERHGETLPDGARLIALSRGEYAVVDASDFDRLTTHNWYCWQSRSRHTRYAMRREVGRSLPMHRAVIECPEGAVCDHIDGDGLNNRRSNLRVATAAQNVQNKAGDARSRTGLKGVCLHKASGLFMATFKARRLGYFKTAAEAAAAYDIAASKAYGGFARLNALPGAAAAPDRVQVLAALVAEISAVSHDSKQFVPASRIEDAIGALLPIREINERIAS